MKVENKREREREKVISSELRQVRKFCNLSPPTNIDHKNTISMYTVYLDPQHHAGNPRVTPDASWPSPLLSLSSYKHDHKNMYTTSLSRKSDPFQAVGH